MLPRARSEIEGRKEGRKEGEKGESERDNEESEELLTAKGGLVLRAQLRDERQKCCSGALLHCLQKELLSSLGRESNLS